MAALINFAYDAFVLIVFIALFVIAIGVVATPLVMLGVCLFT